MFLKNIKNLKKGIRLKLSVSDYADFLDHLIDEVTLEKEDSEKLATYFMALNKEIPEEWLKYLESFKQIKDPEYSEYMRLKEKFEKDNS